jgi:hypothetical protein
METISLNSLVSGEVVSLESYLLLENGNPILLEDESEILLEESSDSGFLPIIRLDSTVTQSI